MKQFTTPEQTAKLIELGFEKPKSEVKAEQAGDYAWYNPAYSIGELIEILSAYQLCLDIRSIDCFVTSAFGRVGGVFTKNEELIDALFNQIIKLKEAKAL